MDVNQLTMAKELQETLDNFTWLDSSLSLKSSLRQYPDPFSYKLLISLLVITLLNKLLGTFVLIISSISMQNLLVNNYCDP